MRHFKKSWFLVLMLFLTFVLRLPSLFEPYWHADEGISLTVGLAIKRGLLLYRDIYDNRPPLLYFITALAGNLFWLRFFLLVSVIGSVVFIDKIAKIIFEKNKLANKISVFFFVIFINTPFVEGNIAHPELLQILPTLIAVWLLIKNRGENEKNYFLSGLLFSFSMMLKIPAFFDLVPTLIYLFLFLNRRREPRFKQKLAIFLFGLTLPFLASMLFFTGQHYLGGFLQAIFFENLGYLSSWKTNSHQISIIKSNLIPKGLLLVIFVSFLYWKRNRFFIKDLFSILWLGFSLVSASLSGRPYAHYLIQTLPPLALIIGRIITNKKLSPGLAFFSVLILIYSLTSLSPFRKMFSTYGVFSYYQNFLEFSFGQKSKEAYFSYFDPRVPAIYQVGRFLSSSTQPSDHLFIWADIPQLYALTKRLPVGRYTAAYHILDHNEESKIVQKLETDRPKVIIVDSKGKLAQASLKNFLDIFYSQFKKIDSFEIYNLIQPI